MESGIIELRLLKVNQTKRLPKSGMAGTDKLVLGARAPSPAEACAARSISTSWTLFSRFALIAGEGARVPSTNRLVPDWIDFWAKLGETISLANEHFGLKAAELP